MSARVIVVHGDHLIGAIDADYACVPEKEYDALQARVKQAEADTTALDRDLSEKAVECQRAINRAEEAEARVRDLTRERDEARAALARVTTEHIGCDGDPRGVTFPSCSECFGRGEPGDEAPAHKPGCRIDATLKGEAKATGAAGEATCPTCYGTGSIPFDPDDQSEQMPCPKCRVGDDERRGA